MIDKAISPNILVIGDVMLDKYLWGDCTRISPEAPTQLVDIQKEETLLGGAGNVAVNIQALSSKATILSVIGDDKAGKDLKKILKKQNINNYIVEEKNRKTTQKTRIIATHSQVIRYDNENKNDICKDTRVEVFEIFKNICHKFDVILLSDYAKGVLTNRLTRNIIEYANTKNIKTLVDPKGENYAKYNKAYMITPNKQEIKKAFGIDIGNKKSIKKALLSLKNVANIDIPLITLSEEGIAYLDKKVKIKKTVAKNVYDVTGAGDTVLATLGYAIARNMEIPQAIKLANIAGGIVVGKIGTGTASLDEIQDSKQDTSSVEHKIKTHKEIKLLAIKLKKQNKKIVFTNGCFDLLHMGHTSYLHKAKQEGDILIVGLNSDNSVRELKGKNRPINNEYDRAFVLASLASVDYVVIFNEETPYEIIKSIKPYLLVKGDDYLDKEIIGSDIAKKTKLIKGVENKSTSGIISIIGKLFADGVLD